MSRRIGRVARRRVNQGLNKRSRSARIEEPALVIPRMADAASTVSELTPEPTSSGRAATILIVEDDAAMRMMLREALEEDGYNAEAVGGGRAGIERVKQGGVDLVISDVKMPDLDGLDMLREIKAVTPSPHV